MSNRGLGRGLVLGLFVAPLVIGRVALAASPSAPVVPRANASAEAPSRDGTFELEWGDADAAAGAGQRWIYDVQIAAPPDEATYLDWYQGTALQSFVSGVPDGEARVRVRRRAGPDAPWSPWSEVLVVPVQHHEMDKAVALMALGFVVFAIISGFIAVMAWRTREGVAG